MTFKFGDKSMRMLTGVHPDLVRVVHRALSYQVMDFSVRDGVRTLETQKRLYQSGASKTMRSKHLKQEDGYGHAVDLYPYPLNMKMVNKGYWPEIIRFGRLAGLMDVAAYEEGVAIEWGCDWDDDGQTLDHTFFDAPHFQLK